MKRIVFFVLFSLTLNFLNAEPATKQPVRFVFSIVRISDSIAYVHAKAQLAKGYKLFSTQRHGSNDAFYSVFSLTDGKRFSHTGDRIGEKGKSESLPQADGSVSLGYENAVEFDCPVHLSKDTATVKGSFVWLATNADGSDFPSGEEHFSLQAPATASVSVAGPAAANSAGASSLLSIFILTIGAGLLSVITPCVFPLIPVTVSFFLKKSENRVQGIRNALWYSISIILIYTIPTLLLTKIFGGSILYTISTSAISNIIFFVIFVIFAISFLGAFDITLPSKWANGADKQAGKGGFMGIFFMALTLVIVSFSCTGPIVGTLLGQTSTSGVSLAPVIGMLGFGIGLALPFSVFAFFPSMLHSLPKSGGWLNSVKVVFGFIEIALSVKFLSNVDLIYHWHLLNRDVFLCLWIVISFLIGLYLLGKLKFSHDSNVAYVSIPKLFLAIFFLGFAVYLSPGLWGAPLRPLSGFIPPIETQDFNLDNLKYLIGNAGGSGSQTISAAAKPKKYIDKLSAPFGLEAYFDLDEGLAAAKVLHKPVMLDFTGHSCANCRKMEEQVWKDPEVLKRIKNDFVLISLYVDESAELPASEQTKTADGRNIETLGDKNLNYEITKFGFNAQPLYMFLDLDGNTLSDVKYGYDPDVQKFIHHLSEVKAKFDRKYAAH